MIYRLAKLKEGQGVRWIFIVGCGGTGGYVADGVARLIAGKNYRLCLMDPDRVESKNLVRQNFVRADLGKFKARVLAERLARDYGILVDYMVSPIEQLPIQERGDLTIGCVDNASAREQLQFAGDYSLAHVRYSYRYFDGWYIDAGNGENSGQVLIGNSLLKECQKGFRPQTGIVEKLPLPQVQQPGLLAPAAKPQRRRDCAAAVVAEEQSPVINKVMADLVVTFVHKLLLGTLTWMGAYVDLEAGTLRTIDAEVETVSRITGYSVKQLEYRPRAVKPLRVRA